MAHVIALGNVTVSQDGVVCYVTKVMATLLYFLMKVGCFMNVQIY